MPDTRVRHTAEGRLAGSHGAELARGSEETGTHRQAQADTVDAGLIHRIQLGFAHRARANGRERTKGKKGGGREGEKRTENGTIRSLAGGESEGGGKRGVKRGGQKESRKQKEQESGDQEVERAKERGKGQKG